MNIVSLEFLAFAAGLVIVYYIIPKKLQWPLLLVASLVFYGMSDLKHIVFILITAVSTYACTRLVQKSHDEQAAYLKEHKAELSKEEKKAYKAKGQSRRKLYVVLALVLNFGMLCAFKYVHFAIEQLNILLTAGGGTGIVDTFSMLIPLGISFYTFQTSGYILDVFWKKCEAEKNFLKVLLFTSFFPQITQGPISNFTQLTSQMFAPHSFSYHNYSWGIQRMIWGFFKKMVVADTMALFVQDVFANYAGYSSIAALAGCFMYSIQIYADFSGYMDMMCGLCQILGIELQENFMRPYFSKSIAEYWRRWHISLCQWFRAYMYYPLAVAKWNQHLGRWCKKNLGPKVGKVCGDYLPATIALVVVWLATGLWHGASWAYIAWGGVNGLFIILTLWLEKPFTAMKKACHINEESRLWQAFQTVRTFILVTFIKCLPEVGTLAAGLGLWGRVFTAWSIPHGIGDVVPMFATMDTMHQFMFIAACLGTVLMFIVSMFQRKKQIRARLDVLPIPVRACIYAALLVLIISFGVPASWEAGGFLYANF